MSLLLNKGEFIKFPLEVLDLLLQLLLFASRRVCGEFCLGDRFEVSDGLFLSSLEEAAVVRLPEVLSTARDDRDLVGVPVSACSVSDVEFYLPSSEESYLLIEVIEQNYLSARVLHSMGGNGKNDQYILVGVLLGNLVEVHAHVCNVLLGAAGVMSNNVFDSVLKYSFADSLDVINNFR